MGITDGLGRLARDWARSKATELLTTDSGERADAAAAADATARTARDDVGERAVRAALPGLDQLATQVEERRRTAADEQRRSELAELDALPRAQVTLRLSGAVSGELLAELPLRWELDGADLAVEVVPPPDARVSVDGHALTRLAFVVPECAGDGTYDLAALYRARAASGVDDHLDWGVDLDEPDLCFYFTPDAGPSSVTIGDEGRRVEVTLAMSGAAGAAWVSATLSR